MHIEKYRSNGIDYLRLVEGKRMKDRNGSPIVGKRVVASLGAYARHDDGNPDYLSRLRQSFREGRPLIDALKPYLGDAPKQEWVVKFRAGDPRCRGETKRLAACILDPVFSALGLDQLLASVKHASKIRYDLQGIVRLLVYGRILEPASKCATMDQNGKYYEPLVGSSNPDNVYDALTVLDENAEKIFRRMNTCVKRGVGRNPSTVFYDVTNFFFEIPDADPDVEAEVTGKDGKKSTEAVPGLRKFGVSKENRRQPIVQIGLFMDDNGIPISFGMFPGNTLDHHTLRPALKETVDTLGLGRFILVADRGMYSGMNMCHVMDEGNGYIVSKSLRKSTAAERRWAVSPEGYTVVSGRFRFKSRTVVRTVTDEKGRRRRMTEKVVVYWSKAFYDRDVFEHRKFLDFIERLRSNPAGFRVSAAQSRSLKRFLKKDVVNSRNGEVLDGTKLVAMIDDDKLNEFNELMGYYQIATSELEMDDRAVIDTYHGLTQIEDQFREMKGTLEARPVFVNTPEHIRAHLLVCFIALTMMRLIQRKIAAAETGKDDGGDLKWSYGMSGARLSAALREWQVCELPQEYYMMQNTSGEDICRILSAFGIDNADRIYTKGGLAAMKSGVKAF
jgi:hypothetical protein